jgi:transcriptional regulator with XRE-family HTH domain
MPKTSKLRGIRLERGWTQHELSRRSNVPSYYISKFERGTTQPWPKARKQLAEALDMSEEEIFPSLLEQKNQIPKP